VLAANRRGIKPKPIDVKTPVQTIASLLLVSGTITWLVTLIL